MAQHLVKQGRAIVIGGGIAGTLAAIAAAEHCAEVLLLERDEAWGSAQGRSGAPQGHHPHMLLCGGMAAMQALWPDLPNRLRAAGAEPVDFCADLAFHHFGGWKVRCPSPFTGTIQSRPLLEHHLLERARALTNLACRKVNVTGLAGNRTRVTGVVLRHASGSVREEADLVIDASGRGSRLPTWLASLGVDPPAEETVQLEIAYATARWRLPPDPARDWRALLIFPRAPAQRRAGYILPMEGGGHLVTLAGYLGERPGTDPAGFRAYARGLPHQALHRAIADGEPAGDIHAYRLRAQRRLRYDRQRDMCSGIVAIGDAVCVLDPLFGQGMSVAARQAVALRRALANGPALDRGGIRRLRADIFDATRLPWLLTSSEAYRYPEVAGVRRLQHRLVQAHAARVFDMSTRDADVSRTFMGLMQLCAPLSAFAPKLLLASLRRSLGSRGAAPAARSGDAAAI
jgi:flavin-dependent dehydrogenase